MIPASNGKAKQNVVLTSDLLLKGWLRGYFIKIFKNRDLQTSRSTEEMIQGHMLIVIPAPESVKKILASSESSRKPRMVATMSPVSRLLSRPLLSARENRKSSEVVTITTHFVTSFSYLPTMSVPDRTIMLAAND